MSKIFTSAKVKAVRNEQGEGSAEFSVYLLTPKGGWLCVLNTNHKCAALDLANELAAIYSRSAEK